MITIFNGRPGVLEEASTATESAGEEAGPQAVWLQVSVRLGSYLDQFPGASLRVLLCLASFSNEHGICWPSMETIERRTGCVRGTVRAALAHLRELTIEGRRVVVSRQRRDASGRQTTNEYLIWACPEEELLFASYQYPAPGANARNARNEETAAVALPGAAPLPSRGDARKASRPVPRTARRVKKRAAETRTAAKPASGEQPPNQSHSVNQNHLQKDPAANQTARSGQSRMDGEHAVAADFERPCFPEPQAVPSPEPHGGDPEYTARVARLIDAGLNGSDARHFARAFPDGCDRQLTYLPYSGPFRSSPGAFLRRAIEEDFAPPPKYTDEQKRLRDVAARQEAQEARIAADKQRWEKEDAARKEAAARRRAEEPIKAARREAAQADPELWAAVEAEARRRVYVSMHGSAMGRHLINEEEDNVLRERAEGNVIITEQVVELSVLRAEERARQRGLSS